MAFTSVLDAIGNTPLVHLNQLSERLQVQVLAKLEMLNPSGSVKDRSAKFMIEQGIAEGLIYPGTRLIESSSGNFAIAAAVVAKVYGLQFTCVVDPTICDANLKILGLLGASVHVVETKDDTGGYLKNRLSYVQELLSTDDESLWLNQYGNQANWRAHYEGVASEIIEEVEKPPQYLIIAVSTTGTIMGVARRLREEYPEIKVVAVDAEGSVIFGRPGAARSLPGLGSSVQPEILDADVVDEVCYVSAQEAKAGAHQLVVSEGILAGGSSGAVVTALERLAPGMPAGSRIVTLFPDRGERYLDSIYAETPPVSACFPARRQRAEAATASPGRPG